MLTISLFIALLCRCNDPVVSEVPPGHGMGVRYTERGLEKFCQKGYSIVPDILAQLPPFEIEGIALGGSGSHCRTCASVRSSSRP